MKKDRPTTARELMNFGWDYLMINLYKEGKLSLGTLSEKLELSRVIQISGALVPKYPKERGISNFLYRE